MSNLLNKTFFRFAVGFVAIVAVSLFITAFVTYSGEGTENPSADFFVAGEDGDISE